MARSSVLLTGVLVGLSAPLRDLMKPALFIAALILVLGAVGALYSAGPETKVTNGPCTASSASGRSGAGSSNLPSCVYERTSALERVKGGLTELHGAHNPHR